MLHLIIVIRVANSLMLASNAPGLSLRLCVIQTDNSLIMYSVHHGYVFLLLSDKPDNEDAVMNKNKRE